MCILAEETREQKQKRMLKKISLIVKEEPRGTNGQLTSRRPFTESEEKCDRTVERIQCGHQFKQSTENIKLGLHTIIQLLHTCRDY